ncbi:D-3-phosphoglycerate dehydrogenase/D-3-phosphoglycerate dehydrogenase [Nocardia tenerifensis]|uniref:D-3-phosphoglycerate dehydrogenase/D-3-phosphoglycerate dehydrogenase n=1 Tax=Nocardia tenerifensis TaxID=228006 RepID=A0A318KC50_9NOCA|nr:NAD(P)-dependent oxidoreductase [Nocardia tenerifensis]PXX55584.1 D-3-phosphoglycerate dehydrogenase/D-3-phosphoglycerate dehydrogenase [Nocardia tenerifensis]
MRVVYTDPAWALNEQGRPDPARADIERTVFGDGIDLRLGLFDGRYVVQGPEFHDHVRGADALVIYRCQVTPELLDAVGPNCRVIARSGVGIDNLNAPLLAGTGIVAFNVPDYCVDEVSTHTLALLLALERKVCTQNRLVKIGRWNIHAGGVPRRVATCTAGIIGFGRIGRATARKLQAFYRNIIAYDPYVSADLMAGYGVTAVGDLTELFAAADSVVIHAALTEETDRLVDATALAAVRPGALLVNTARGRLVDPAAALEALEAGRLGGFASDVFTPEDPNDDPTARKLLPRDDVVVSAHRAFLSAESERSCRRRIAEGVATVLAGGPPPAEGRVT